jgi:hypothetical protein
LELALPANCRECRFSIPIPDHPAGDVFCAYRPPAAFNTGPPGGQPNFVAVYPIIRPEGMGCGQFDPAPIPEPIPEPPPAPSEPSPAPAMSTDQILSMLATIAPAILQHRQTIDAA